MDLHLIACGDFTLLGRQAWEALRGYPEFDCYSMHIDSVLCCQAHYAGYLQHFLPPPAVAFHIEHSLGSGWTPEGEAALFGRLQEQGIKEMNFGLLWHIAERMRTAGGPLVLNTENWGLHEFDVTETAFAPARAQPVESNPS